MRTITYWLSLVFIFNIPWESMIDVGRIGTIGRTTGLLFAACWVALVVMTKKPIRKPHFFHYVFFVYVLWNYLSIFWTIDIDLTLNRIHTYPQLLGFSYILWDLYQSEDEIKNALQAFVFGLWVDAGFLISLFLAGETIRSAFFIGTNFDPNNNGVILALGIPFAWYLFTMKQEGYLPKILKIVNMLYIPTAVFGILFTASRGALITSITAFLFIFFTQGRLKLLTKIIVIPVLIYALFLILPYVPEASLERLATAPENIASGDLNGRVEIWRAGLDAFLETPLLGVGSHAFRSATDIGKLVHNTYLEVLFELGLIGFAIFAVLIFITIRAGLKLPGRARSFWLAILVVLGIGIFSLNWLHRKTTWFIPSMIIINSALVYKDIKDVRISSRATEKKSFTNTDLPRHKQD